jgi:hypothetical protein
LPLVKWYKSLQNDSNSKFKTSLGRSSHWTTIKGDHLKRRLDVSAYKIFEFGIADKMMKIIVIAVSTQSFVNSFQKLL